MDQELQSHERRIPDLEAFVIQLHHFAGHLRMAKIKYETSGVNF